MKRRSLMKMLGAASVILAVPGVASASEGGASVALGAVPVVRGFRPGQSLGRRGGLTLIAVPRGKVPIRDVFFSLFWEPHDEEHVLVGPEYRRPECPAPGEYFAPLVIPPNATAGTYSLRWRVEMADGTVEHVDHFFPVSLACRGEFTIVKSGVDERGAFLFSLRCDQCEEVSPTRFGGSAPSEEFFRWHSAHSGWEQSPAR